MTCQEYLDRLLEGLSADAPDGRAAEEHEQACAKCRERGASMRAALAGLASLPAGTPPGFARAAMSKVAHTRAPWEQSQPTFLEKLTAWLTPRLIPATCAAAACVLLAAGAFRSGPGKPAGGTELARLTGSSGPVAVKEERGAVAVEVPAAGYAKLALGEVADAVFAESTYARVTGNSLVELTSGEVRLDVHHARVGPEKFRVVTPHFVVTVTGTEFMVRVTPEESVVTLFRGRVSVKPTVAGGEEIEMQPNERVRATPVFIRRDNTARPEWPMLPTATPTEPAQPVSASRPPATLSGAPDGAAGASRAGAPPPGPADVKTAPAGSNAAPVQGTALPDVPSNANVHEPFRQTGP